MVIWPLLLACLAGGWVGGTGLGTRGVGRVLLSLPLGVGLWLAWVFLLSFFIAPMAAILAAALLAAGSGLWLGRTPVRVVRPALGWPFWSLLVLAGALAWLSLVGGCQLSPPRDFLLFELPRIAQLVEQGASREHPLGPQALSGVTPFATAAAVGADPLKAALILGGASQLLTVLAWLLLLARCNPTAPLAVVLGGIFLFLGSPQGWLVSELPSSGAVHLLAVLALWIGSVRRLEWALPVLAGLAVIDLHLALALGLAALASHPRQRLVLVLGLALGVLQGGASLALLAAGLLWWFHPNRMVRVLSAAEFFCPGMLFGLAALGIAMGRTATVLWKRYPGDPLEVSLRPSLALRIPRRLLVGCAAVLALWRALIPGEEVFNDRILIYSQEQKVRLEQLLWPHSLPSWAAWRGTALGLEPSDVTAAQELRGLVGPVVYLTGQPEEKVEVAALVSALAGGRALAGWYVGLDGAALLPAAAAVASTGRTDLLRGTSARWLMRRGQSTLAIEPLPSTSALISGKPDRIERWGTLHWLESEKGAKYEVLRNGTPFGPDFSVVAAEQGPVPFQLPLGLEGDYLVTLFNSTQRKFTAPASPPIQAVLRTSTDVPSRSLLPLTLTLTNTADVPLDLSDLRGGRLSLRSLAGKPPKPAPVSPLLGLVLQPKQSTDLTVHLRTPSAPDVLEVELDLIDARGAAHSIPFAEPLVLRAWNRRPLLTVPDGMVKH